MLSLGRLVVQSKFNYSWPYGGKPILQKGDDPPVYCEIKSFIPVVTPALDLPDYLENNDDAYSQSSDWSAEPSELDFTDEEADEVHAASPADAAPADADSPPVDEE